MNPAGKLDPVFSTEKVSETFNVRIVLDEERINFFIQSYSTGLELPPIVIDEKSFDLIDGRHRLEAQRRLGRLTVAVILVPHMNKARQLVAAVSANLGGALPMAHADLVKAFTEMVAQKLRLKDIRKAFVRYLSAEVCRRIYEDATGRLNKARLNAACAYMASHNTTPEAAAEKFDVSLKSLQNKLNGTGELRYDKDADQLKSKLGKTNRSHGSTLSPLFTMLLDGYDASVYTTEEVESVLKYQRAALKSATHTLDNYYKRFENAKESKARISVGKKDTGT